MRTIRIGGVLLFAALLTTALTAGSCGYRDPCVVLAPPTSSELAVVAAGAEVERELPNGVECELVGRTWQAERD